MNLHPRPGRPKRQDWREPHALLDERYVGTAVVLSTSKDGGGQRRGQIVSADQYHVRYRDAGGVDRSVSFSAVQRWRVVQSVLRPGDLVLMHGRSEHEWRGVVVSTDEDGSVEVDSTVGREVLFEGELERADDRRRFTPRVTPSGPPSWDPAVEESKLRARAS